MRQVVFIKSMMIENRSQRLVLVPDSIVLVFIILKLRSKSFLPKSQNQCDNLFAQLVSKVFLLAVRNICISKIRLLSTFIRFVTGEVIQSLMSSELIAAQPSTRIQRLANLRMSIKETTAVGVKTLQLQTKFENMVKMARVEGRDRFDLSSCPSLEGSFSDDEAETGTSFSDKYELLQKLGEGGNACVFKCQYKKTQKIYAVKRFRLEEEHVLELKKSFINLKDLDHHSVIKYRALHIDQQQHCAFLVMDYVPFPSLEDYRPKTEDQLRHIVKELISAIAYIHNKNICHRDIKPENILYDQVQKKIKIIDFGISKKTFQRGTRRDMLTIIGTQFYLAPEIYIGGGYDEKVDLWALGVTIFKLVTGYTPFESEYHSDTVSNILKGTFSFEDKIWGRYNPFLKDFISQFLREKETRMSLKQAEKHLWLQSNHFKSKIHKYSSFNVELSEDFHNQMRHKMKHANSREEGEMQNSLKLYKSINLIGVEDDYDLEDSDDESTVVSPLTHSLTLPRKGFEGYCISLQQMEPVYKCD